MELLNIFMGSFCIGSYWICISKYWHCRAKSVAALSWKMRYTVDYLDFRVFENIAGSSDCLAWLSFCCWWLRTSPGLNPWRETEGDFSARFPSSPENGRHHALCPQALLWALELQKCPWAGGKRGRKAGEKDVHPKRQLLCVFSKIGHRGAVWRRLCKGHVSSCLNCPFLHIISKEWGREGNLVVRTMLQLSLFKMHSVAFLWEDYCPGLFFPCI